MSPSDNNLGVTLGSHDLYRNRFPAPVQDSTAAGPGTIVDREKERAQIEAALESASGGLGRAIFLSGEPGIGKTRLAEELVARARERGAVVLTGHCHEGDGTPVYWMWVQVVRAYLRAFEPDVVRSVMGAGVAYIGQVIPEVREHLRGLPPPLPHRPAQVRFRFCDSMTRFLVAVAARTPLVLVFEALHCADTSSLLLLQFLVRELADARILVLGTFRDTEVTESHPLTSCLGQLAGHGYVESLILGGLDRDAAPTPVAHVAVSSRAPEATADVFRLAGDYWTIGYDGAVFQLRDSVGLRALAHLLRHPGREFCALELIALVHGNETSEAPHNGGDRGDGEHLGLPGDAGDLLDARAKSVYRARLMALRENLDEAQACNDTQQAAALQSEIDFLARELARAVGLGGRDRQAGSPLERARLNVSRGIDRAIRKIGHQNVGLRNHLSATIKTGTYCTYTPDPRHPTAWKF